MIIIRSKLPERTLCVGVPYGRGHRALCAKPSCPFRVSHVSRFSRHGSQAWTD
jgi:hypothetical protein